MDANTLNTIAELPAYVLIFAGVMSFLYVMRQLSVASTVQAETTKAALALVASAQQEVTARTDRWLSALATMNDGFIAAISGQTAAIAGHGARLDTIDTSVSGLPKLALAAQGADAMVDEIVAAIQANGVDIRAVNLRLGYMAVDTKSIAQYLVNPTEPNKQDVQEIADAPAGDTVVGRPEPKGTDVVPPEPAAAVATVDSAAAKAAVAAVGAVAAATIVAADAVNAVNAEPPA